MVDLKAETGREVIAANVAVDDQAPFLGEVALVDGELGRRAHRPRLLQHAVRRERDAATSPTARASGRAPALAGLRPRVLAAGVNVAARTSTS